MAALAYARGQLREARTTREATERPFIVVDLDETRVNTMVYLTITNHGKSIARDVEFEVTPPIKSSIVDEQGLRVLDDGLTSLAPGRTISFLFDSFLERSRASELPDAYEIGVTYRGDVRDKPYSESQHIDLGLFADMQYIDRKTIHHVHHELHEIRKQIAKWTSTFPQGLHVLTDQDLQRYRERRHERFDVSVSEAEQETGNDGPEPPTTPPAEV